MSPQKELLWSLWVTYKNSLWASGSGNSKDAQYRNLNTTIQSPNETPTYTVCCGGPGIDQ